MLKTRTLSFCLEFFSAKEEKGNLPTEKHLQAPRRDPERQPELNKKVVIT
jgi:hypothetical protein